MNPTSHSCETPYQAPQLTSTPTACFRGVRIALHIIYGMLLAGAIPLLNKSTQQHIVQYWSRKFLDLLHVGLETYGCYHHATAQGRLIVANHISWLDAVSMNAVLPAYFVAKSEVGDWPFLGWIFHRINTLFIKRDIRQETARALTAKLKEYSNREIVSPCSRKVLPPMALNWAIFILHCCKALLILDPLFVRLLSAIMMGLVRLMAMRLLWTT